MDLEISTSWKWQKDPNIWSRCKVEIHGAEEIERDILCSSKKIFFVLASGDRTFENVAKLSPVAWSKKNLSHSTSYFSFVT